MPFSESDATRVRATLKRRKNITEKQMFGGLGFLLRGNMLAGLWKEFLILRIDPADYPDLLQQPHVKPFDITGRAMSGWIMVEPEGFRQDAALRNWLDLALAYVSALPVKTGSASKKKKP